MASQAPTTTQLRLAALITKEVADAISTVATRLQTIQPLAPATTSRCIFKRSRSNKKRRPYNGTHPLCNRCGFHHAHDSPCRLCTNCGRYNHLADKCREPRTPPPPATLSTQQTQSQYPLGTCFNCGDPTHYKNACPKLVNTIDTQAQANL